MKTSDMLLLFRSLKNTVYMNSSANTALKQLSSNKAIKYWLFCFCVFCLLYLLTTQRGVSWQDSGMFQWRVLSGEYTNPLGLTLAHPLYIAVARLVAGSDQSFSPVLINTLSSFAAAAALAFLFLTIYELTNRVWLGLTAAAIFAVSHTLWWLATITETYTLHLMLFSIELYILVKLIKIPSIKKVLLLGLINGMGWSVHNLALLVLPVYLGSILWLVSHKKLSVLAALYFLLAFALGASPFLYLGIQDYLQTRDLNSTVQSVLFGKFRSEVLGLHFNWSYLKYNLVLSSLNFLNIILPASVVGIIAIRKQYKPSLYLPLYVIGAVEFMFFVRYNIVDQFMFILPSVAVLTVFAAVGIDYLYEQHRNWRTALRVLLACSIILPPCIYWTLPRIVEKLELMPSRARNLPYRDEVRYWVVPWKNSENSAQRAAIEALEEASPDGVIITDSNLYYPMKILQTSQNICENVSVHLKDEFSNNNAYPSYQENYQNFTGLFGNRTIFIVSPVKGFVPDWIYNNAAFIKSGILYRVKLTTPDTAVKRM